jgi:superfamily II DNA or RNA helicase
MKDYILECIEEQEGSAITAKRLVDELCSHDIKCSEEQVRNSLSDLLAEGRVKHVDIGLKHLGWLIVTDFQNAVTESIPDPIFVEEVKPVPVVPIKEEVPVPEAPPPQLPMNPTSTLHAWQEKAWAAWEGAGYQGMLEAITGSGKTVFAIECAKRLNRLHRPLNTLIVVPTIPLMHQWKKSIEKFAGDDFRKVGLLGDGHEDNFSKSPIVVAVVNSASKRVNELLQHTLGSDARVKSLLIADEVHRYQNAAQFGQVLEFPYRFKLGMSATIDHFEDPRLGRIFFSYTFADARADGLIDEFDMVNVEIPLNGKEQTEYNDLSEQFKDQLDKVKNLYSDELKRVPDDWLFGRLKQIMDRDPDGTSDIKRLFSLLFRRSRVTHVAVNKIGMAKKITALLLQEAERKSIVFFERIQSAIDVEDNAIKTAAEDLENWVGRQDYGIWCKTIHSGHNRGERTNILEEFRNRRCAALLACRMLDEGLDVPEIDAAVLVSSTQTLRQRIQRIGRALRKSPHGKRPLIVSLYIPGTGDQNTTLDDREIFRDVAKIYEANISNCMSIIRNVLCLNN